MIAQVSWTVQAARERSTAFTRKKEAFALRNLHLASILEKPAN